AADVDQIVLGGVEPGAGPSGLLAHADPAPFAAPAEKEQVAAVGVDVHLLGVECEQAELHHAASRRKTAEPTWVSLSPTSRRSRTRSPEAAASASSVAASSSASVSRWSSSRISPPGETRWRRRLTTS